MTLEELIHAVGINLPENHELQAEFLDLLDKE